ncbi:hypothetical protein MLD38_010207 [Melastoma candidum]|uniref:Uncharacterized protein n=1 Tax=Melastoma candidum TaxID=119954 RepID=A0ACB9QYH2_9MYRT|nr:hypothetical protein MLD38_010207 [Melastoma candidum]
MMQNEHAQQPLSVPPGFRFHPTDEELLYYYLKKKVSYEAFDLDVIKEVDLNKFEPWDLKGWGLGSPVDFLFFFLHLFPDTNPRHLSQSSPDKCKIGSGPQDEWYFFSHKDKKYPTGTRTNRATTAGFWKATGRDKSIHLPNRSGSRRICMRKTLVFYTGRAPHGQKTDWIMHEYRLEDEHGCVSDLQEDGWVVCRVFKKKNQKGYQAEAEELDEYTFHAKTSGVSTYNHSESRFPSNYGLDCSMHLPQLFSPEVANAPAFPRSSFGGTLNMDIECSQNLLRLTSAGGGGFSNPQDRFGNDWSFLDKLLSSSSSSHHCLDQQPQSRCYNSYGPAFHAANDVDGTSSHTKIGRFQYLGGSNVQTSQDNVGENIGRC